MSGVESRLVDNRLVPDAAFMIGGLEENNKWIRSDIKRVDIISCLEQIRNQSSSKKGMKSLSDPFLMNMMKLKL